MIPLPQPVVTTKLELITSSTLERFNYKVNEIVEDGWKPFGPANVTMGPQGKLYYQQFIKLVPIEKDQK